MNKIILIGNLTRDVEYGKKEKTEYAKFGLAVDNKDKTDFFDVVAFDKVAIAVSTYCSKGKKVCVCGAIHNEEYTKKDGTVIKYMKVVAESVEFLSPKTDNPEPDKDIPF